MSDPKVAVAQGVRVATDRILRVYDSIRVNSKEPYKCIDQNIYNTKVIRSLGGFPSVPIATAIINQDAFVQIHPLLDHGYFYDFKTFYWILRAGWKSKYIPEVFFIQKIPAKYSMKRKRYWGRWGEIMKELDRIPDELLQFCEHNKSKDRRYHLNTNHVLDIT